MQDDLRDTVRRSARLAGLPLSEERTAALALLFAFFQPAITLLAGTDCGGAEPAGRFRPPPSGAKR
jgi:hypothetical protein